MSVAGERIERVEAGAGSAAARSEFRPAGVRSGLFGFLLLLMLPFVAALPVMIAQRVMHGQWYELPGLLLLAGVIGGVFALLLLEFLFAMRARFSFGKAAVRFTVPHGPGPAPLLRYRTYDLPYHTIKGVELRREVFGAAILPVLMRNAVVRTRDNREISLGYTRDADDDAAYPLAEIAGEIARRSAVPLVDQRTVWRRSRAERALGYISEIDTQTYIIDQTDIDKINLSHRRLVLGLISVLATMIFLGIFADASGWR